jgi:hypothetical protein
VRSRTEFSALIVQASEPLVGRGFLLSRNRSPDLRVQEPAVDSTTAGSVSYLSPSSYCRVYTGVDHSGVGSVGELRRPNLMLLPSPISSIG